MAFSEPSSPFSGPTEPEEQSRIWQRLSRWLGRDDAPNTSHEKDIPSKPSLGRRLSRRVVPGLPRPPTFRRQQSEKRERLLPVDNTGDQRRGQSLDRRRARSLAPSSTTAYTLAQYPISSLLPSTSDEDHTALPYVPVMDLNQQQIRPMPPSTPPAEIDRQFSQQVASAPPQTVPADVLEQISQELEEKWILNLSMHFRDNSPREKFFVTYAETPTKWRRLTVSCDYRDAPPHSLEKDLQALTYQRDKNARIYDAIRNSLPDIQFYDTVTNLRLQTDQDDRLHVHVTEDINEIIPYPSITAIKHLEYNRVDERDVVFDSHMSGFVYKVRVNNEAFEDKIYVKKEIPGPDSVEEFLYEINALHSLIGTSNVVQFEGLVVEEQHGLVKGLLISYANQGPLIDLIYDFKGTGSLTWERKAKWARQMIYGLSAIHEAGFVQGDCTLSNVVVDQYDDALIIDVNRRGCPVGWEPPEIHNMIDNGHRISLYIGIKSDLFQLGMSLWALFTEEDEPERQSRPLTFSQHLEVPQDMQYLLDVARICLSERPKDRLSAEKLLSFFPQEYSPYTELIRNGPINQLDTNFLSTDRDTIYVDPSRGAEKEIPREHFHPVRQRSESAHRLRRSSTYSEEARRGRTPPRDMDGPPRPLSQGSGSYAGHEEPLIVSISPGREPRFEGAFYGFDLDEEEEQEVQRVLRRRLHMRSLGAAMHGHEGKENDDFNPRPLDHTDLGIDATMCADTPNQDKQPFSRFLDHVDSGLGDMDLEQVESGILTASKPTELEAIDEQSSKPMEFEKPELGMVSRSTPPEHIPIQASKEQENISGVSEDKAKPEIQERTDYFTSAKVVPLVSSGG